MKKLHTILTYNQIQVQIRLDAIVSISTLVRNYPVPDIETVFELNYLNCIKNEEDLQCFMLMSRHSLLPLINDDSLCSAVHNRPKAPHPYDHAGNHWKTLEEKGFNCLNFYAASTLCDFLGIEAQSVLCYHKDYLGLHSQYAALTKVIYHQTAMKTNNKCALDEIMILMRQTYQETVVSYYENEHNTKATVLRTNAESLVRTLMYHACSLITLQWKMTDLASKRPDVYECLFKNLHWQAVNEWYGITLAFNEDLT